MSSALKIGWLRDSNGEKFAPKTLTSQVQTSDGKSIEDLIEESAIQEIYVGDGEMPEDATIQILLDGSDEEQSLKDELKDYISDTISDFNLSDDIVYAEADSFEDIHNIVLKPIKSAYEYAKDGGYTGTEEDFYAELANYASLKDKIDEHDKNSNAHQDIRKSIEEISVPVTSINGKIGDVKLTASDVGAASNESLETVRTLANEAKELAEIKDVSYTYGTTDLVAGVSELASGKLYFVYE